MGVLDDDKSALPSSPRDPAERSSPVDNTRAAARAVLVKGAKRRRRSAPLMRASTSPHWGCRWVRATVWVGAPGRSLGVSRRHGLGIGRCSVGLLRWM